MSRFTKPTVAATLALLLAVFPAALMAEEDVMAMIADGQPWSSTGPNGRKVTLTFFPDGAVQMKVGMMRKKATWQLSNGELCLMGVPGGTRCHRFERSANGFIGYNADGSTTTLTR